MADDKCRATLKATLEDLEGSATRRATIGQASSIGVEPLLVFEEALKALDDPKHKIKYRDRLRDFADGIVKHMHDPACDDYATKTAMVGQI